MELDHFKVKIYSDPSVSWNIENAIPVFHSWIQNNSIKDCILIDVVDYAHVPKGPGVKLIAQEEQYSVEYGSEDRAGLVYQSNKSSGQNTTERLKIAIQRSLDACKLLDSNKEWNDSASLTNSKEIRVDVNDRLLAPNSKDTWSNNQTDIDEALNQVFGAGTFSTEYNLGDVRDLFGFNIRLQA